MGTKHRGKRMFYYKYFTLNKMKEVHIMSKKILKRSLALGALMAFVITGSAWAGETIELSTGAVIELPTISDYSKSIPDDKKNVYGSTGTKYKDGLEDTWVEGCTLERTSNGAANGGAIYSDYNLTVKDCFFKENTITTPNGKKGYGGAISHQTGILKISDSYFVGNSNNTNDYRYGSAIYASNSKKDSIIENCVFYKNTSSAPVWVTGAKSVIELKDNTFVGNHSSIHVDDGSSQIVLKGTNIFENNTASSNTGTVKGAIYNKGTVTFANDSDTKMNGNTRDISNMGAVVIEPKAVVESRSGISSSGEFELNGNLKVGADSTFTNLSGDDGTFEFLKPDIKVDVTNNTATGLNFVADGTVNDAVNGDIEKLIGDDFDANDSGATFELKRGSIVGDVTGKLIEGEDGDYQLDTSTLVEKPHEGNAAISHNANIAMMAWRAETNDMNKRLGELRNANGDLGVWVRMVGGEDEFKSVEYDYTQYQLGYDEKLSVDPSWTVGVALSYTDGESKFTDGSGENTHKGLSVYGSKLNDDGSFIDLIAKYSRLEHDLTSNGDKGDYSTNGYSVSAEYGKRFQQGKGLWIEPQVELTYGKVKSAEYKLGDKTVSQDAMESLVGRVGFSLGKDIKQGNVYARASYLYDFEGETNMAFANSGARREFKYDLGGGWWEVGVGANINLSKATYIYADIEKTFGGEVDTNWQWNLGVRYSF